MPLILTLSTACQLPVVSKSPGPEVEVTGEATKVLDATLLRVHVSTDIKDKNRNAAITTALRNAVAVSEKLKKQYGLTSEDIQILSISISEADEGIIVPVQKEETKPPEYIASVKMLLTFRNFKNVPEILVQLVEAGLTEIDGLSFEVSDPSAEYRSLEVQALQQATKRAELLARSAGFRGVELLSVAEERKGFLPPGYNGFQVANYSNSQLESLSLAQKVLFSAQVHCRFRMVR